MSQLSKQDIKEIFTETLEPFAKSTQQDFQKINNRFDNVDGRLLKVENHLVNAGERLTNIEQDIKWMKENFGELFSKLDKFISLLEKQEQELLFLGTQLRRLEERVIKLESK